MVAGDAIAVEFGSRIMVRRGSTILDSEFEPEFRPIVDRITQKVHDSTSTACFQTTLP